MSAPQGYVALDLVGFTDKGDYAAGSTYVKNDLVHSDNKIYLSLQDNNTGQALPVSPETETAFWKLWLSGGADSLELITAKDTGNLTGGGAGTVVVAQELIDAIVEKYTELNSDLEKTYGLGPTIPQSSNLNDYITPGSFYSQNGNVTKTLLNVPSGIEVGFRLEVKENSSPVWIKQFLYPNYPSGGQKIFIREYDAGTWTNWYHTISNADFNIYTFEQTDISVPANGEILVEFDITRSGYAALGVVGFTSSNSYAVVSRVQTIFSSNKVNMTLRNVSSNQVITIARAQILYLSA